MAVMTYAPDQVVSTFGPVLFSGFGDDASIKVEFNEDRFSLKVGVDGHGTRTKSSNRSGKFTVTLMQSSMCNDLLSAIAALDDKAGQGVFPFLVKDLSGRSLHAAQTAWIVKVPEAGYAKEAGPREWVFETDNLQSFLGGA